MEAQETGENKIVQMFIFALLAEKDPKAKAKLHSLYNLSNSQLFVHYG